MDKSFTANRLPDPIKAKTDKKDYRSIQLSNGLKALLISDTTYPLEKLDQEEQSQEDVQDESEEESEEDGSDEEDEDEEEKEGKVKKFESGLKLSAAALCVNAGSFSDPEILPGMAHFVEHMVFMGSSKFPDENEFDRFINRHGGGDNAHTDTEVTVFYFDVQRRSFRDALDRFSGFFVSPLMKEDAMQRERMAVDSEFEQAKQSDSNRKQQLLGHIANETSPMGKFMWGNFASLSSDKMTEAEVNEMLHKFKDKRYTSKSISLAVQSQHTLDELQTWVEEFFNDVPNNNSDCPKDELEKDPFGEKFCQKMYKVVPVKNTYQVDLYWSLPSLMSAWKQKPLHYLSWIIGHEGHGSIISYLRSKVWALSLYAGNAGDGFEHNSLCSMFSISIVLTKAGFEHLEEVLEAVYAYLNMMTSEGPNKRIFDEISRIEQLNFDFGEEQQPCDYVENLCQNLQLYPAENFINGDDLLFEFDPDLIKDCLKQLNPEKVCLFISARDFADECKLNEKWFGTAYNVSQIPTAWMEKWKNVELEVMKLPTPNKFIADDTELKKPGIEINDYPKKIVSIDGGEMFYKQDLKFLQPRAYIYFFINSKVPMKSLNNSIALDVLMNCVCQLMTEVTYPADLAQLSFSLYSNERGFLLKVAGLNDKLDVLLETILDYLNRPQLEAELSDDFFKAVKEQTKKNYFNNFIKPMKLVRELRMDVLQVDHFNGIERHAGIDQLRKEDVLQVLDEIKSACNIQGLAQGNLTELEAENFFHLVRNKLNVKLDVNASNLRCRKLPEKSLVLRVNGVNPNETTTAVTNYFQFAGENNLENHAKLELLTHLIDEPIFDTLRTKEQLGYTVFATLRNTFGVLGLSVSVCATAANFTPDQVDERIGVFFKEYIEDQLTKMSEAELAENVITLVKLKRTADVTLAEEVTRNWAEIVSGEYLFDRLVKEAEDLERLFEAKDDLKRVLTELTLRKAIKKLSVQIVGNSSEVESEMVIDPDSKFKLNYIVGDEDQCIGENHLEFAKKLQVYPKILLIK